MNLDPHADTLPSDDPASAHGAAGDELIGRTLGHFRIDARLGRGGMGAVYRAWDASLEREVAVKVLLGASESSRERFLREARVQAKLRHPNVVPIHFVGHEDFGAQRRSLRNGELEGREPLEHEGVSFLVMDIVDGESLADLLAREGLLSESRALDVADAIASALAAGSGAGLVHRDVKPSNILVDKQGRVMLADFGLAKNVALGGQEDVRLEAVSQSGTRNLTHAGAILGTPAYLAPEQARGEAVDFRADMYSLGVTLYEALAGQPPFTGEDAKALLRQHVHEAPIAPHVLQPNLRPAVEALVLRLLDKRPAARFASYDELRAAIASARAKDLVPATFFVRAVALAVDLAALGVYATILLLLTKSATVAWLVPSLSFGALERVWSTPGKKLMRLRVVDKKGDPPSWAAMLGRSVLRVFGPIAIGFDSDLLGTHGLFHAPTADATLTIVSTLAWIVALAIGLGGRPLHDRILRTREVFL